MIVLQNAQLRVGGNLLFSELSWRIDMGDRIGLVGPNGSGKTSLLRVIVGEYTLEEGEREIAKNLKIGYLPQDSTELPRERVCDVLWQAFDSLNHMEDQMRQAMRVIESTSTEDPKYEREVKRYGVLEEKFRHGGGYSRESEAKKIMTGLGFSHEDWERPVAEFSGGWRMRVLLAKLLLEKPDILLLDEPTNHLDPESLAWFEQYLMNSEAGLVIVSHDRYFLDRLTTEIAEIDMGKFRLFKGNYSAYKVKKEELRQQLLAQKKNQDREIAHLESFIERFRAKNTKASQAQSRIKRLEKMERIEIESDSSTVAIPMPEVPRSGKEVFWLKEVGHCYGPVRALHKLNATVFRGDRIAVWGANGAGKSTLLSLMAHEMEPTEGEVKWGYNVSPAFFSQHHAELQDSPNSLIDELSNVAPPEMQSRLRDMLGAFLFRGDDVFKKVAVCSGGEKSRLALAKLLIRPINVLIMDEPLNHLDISTVEILEDALKQFAGTIIYVSHDRFFVERLSNQVWEMDRGYLRIYKGTFSDYQYAKQYQEAQQEDIGSPEETSEESNNKRNDRKEQKRREAEERNRINRLRREQEKKCEAIEKQIHEMEAEIEEIEAKLASGELIRSPNEMSKVNKRYKTLLKNKEKLYTQWEKMVESIEEVG